MHASALRLVVQGTFRENHRAKREESRSSKNLGQDVRKFLGGRNLYENNVAITYLFAQPPHPHGKMVIAGRDNRVGGHLNASGIVLVDSNGGNRGRGNFGDKVGNPGGRLGGMDCSKIFCLGSAEAHHRSDFGLPQDRAVKHSDKESIA